MYSKWIHNLFNSDLNWIGIAFILDVQWGARRSPGISIGDRFDKVSRGIGFGLDSECI